MSGNQRPGRDPLEAVRDLIGLPAEDLPEIPVPTHWPALDAARAAGEWESLRGWVERLRDRFALDHHVLPPCWWRHNSHVEVLAALRDHERASYAETAPATGPVEWIRALRDLTGLLGAWTAETGCAAGTHTPATVLRPAEGAGWEDHVSADLAQRQASSDDGGDPSSPG